MNKGQRSQKSVLRRWWHIAMRTVRGVTRLEDTPYRIAMGSACGLFTACLPMLGQMLLAMLLAKILRASVIASVPWTWLTNPLTTLPIWYGCYVIGTALIGREALTMSAIKQFIDLISDQGFVETLTHGGALLGSIMLPLILGTVLVGIILATGGYALIKLMVIRVQRRRSAVLHDWHHRLRQPEAAPSEPRV